MKEILGYRGSNFLTYKYITLCSGGIKPEGMPTKAYSDPCDAWIEFREQLKNFTSKYNKKKCTLIWRMKPILKEYEDKCYVVARLAIYPDDIFKILKDKGFYFTKTGNPRFNSGHCLTSNINEISEEDWGKLLISNKK